MKEAQHIFLYKSASRFSSTTSLVLLCLIGFFIRFCSIDCLAGMLQKYFTLGCSLAQPNISLCFVFIKLFWRRPSPPNTAFAVFQKKKDGMSEVECPFIYCTSSQGLQDCLLVFCRIVENRPRGLEHSSGVVIWNVLPSV